jgi:hypothetical protein
MLAPYGHEDYRAEFPRMTVSYAVALGDLRPSNPASPPDIEEETYKRKNSENDADRLVQEDGYADVG